MIGNHPARKIGDDVIAFPFADVLGQRVTPFAETIRHIRKMFLTIFQRARAIGVIGFAEEEEG